MTNMSRSEFIAQAVVEHFLPGCTMDYQPDQHNGECDFLLRYSNGITVPLEVTVSTKQKLRATIAAIKERNSVKVDSCKKDWVVHPLADADIKSIRSHVDSYVAKIEQLGLIRFVAYSDAPQYEPVKAIFRDLGIEAGFVTRWETPGVIGVMYPSSGGLVSAAELLAAIDTEASNDGNIRKLTVPINSDSHLFISIDMYNYLPWKVLVDTDPPNDPPKVPRQISHVWTVARTRDIDTYRVWLFTRSGPWSDLGVVSIAVPPELRWDAT